MIKTLRLSFAALLILSASSCSQKLTGTWTIANYESKSGTGQNIAVANIGDITFKKNNTGVKKITYSLFENKVEDNSEFKWQKAENGETITITGEGSQLNKTWLIIKDDKKYQKWKSTDGGNTVQVLELKKQ